MNTLVRFSVYFPAFNVYSRVSVYTLGRISSYFLCMSVYSPVYQYTLLCIDIFSCVSVYTLLCRNVCYTVYTFFVSVQHPVNQCALYSVYFCLQYILSVYQYTILCTNTCFTVYYVLTCVPVYTIRCMDIYSPASVYTLLYQCILSCAVQGTAGADGGGIFLRFVRPRGFERGRV